MMNSAMQMMQMHEKDMSMMGMDMAMMQECMEACSACEQACTMCSNSMTGESMATCMGRCATWLREAARARAISAARRGGVTPLSTCLAGMGQNRLPFSL